jgi:hypothetical protein
MAAQACPTKAIKIIDRYTGNQIFPWKRYWLWNYSLIRIE